MNANPWNYKEDNRIKAQRQVEYMDELFPLKLLQVLLIQLFILGL